MMKKDKYTRQSINADLIETKTDAIALNFFVAWSSSMLHKSNVLIEINKIIQMLWLHLEKFAFQKIERK